jgi:hypothetical protein
MGVLRRIRGRAAKVDASRPLQPLSCGSPGLRLRYFQPHKAPLTRLHKTSPQYIYLPIHATATATGAGVQKRRAPRNDLDHEQPGGKLLTIRRAHRYAWPWAVDTAAQTHLPHAHGATKDSAQPGGEAAQAATATTSTRSFLDPVTWLVLMRKTRFQHHTPHPRR